MAYASPNSWVVKTSKRLSYELRHNSNRALGRLNNAQFENLPMLQAFKWSPVKILAFLLSNSKSRFAIHLQLREFMRTRRALGHLHLGVRIPGSHPLQRHSLGRELWQAVDHVRPHEPRQGVPLHQEPQLRVHQQRRAPVVGDTWRTGRESTGDTLRVSRGEVGPQAGTVVLYGRDVFYCQLDYWLFYQEGHELYLTT